MAELLTITILAIIMGIILIGIGLSFISQSLNPLEFNESWQGHSSKDYYKNPLYTLNSKYWHYRPMGSVVVSKQQWEEIEKNVGIKINQSEEKGKDIGYNKAIVEIQNLVEQEEAKTFPNSPYAILNIESTATVEEVNKKYKHLLKVYDSRNFVDLDKAFIQLAEIRTAQIKKAWKKISFGLVRTDNG